MKLNSSLENPHAKGENSSRKKTHSLPNRNPFNQVELWKLFTFSAFNTFAKKKSLSLLLFWISNGF